MDFYTVSDIHGFFEEFYEALEKSGFFDNDRRKKLVVCGDILDRGPNACKIVDFLLDLKDKNMLKYIRGNHADLLEQALYAIDRGEIFEIACGMSHHYQNGTWDTILQLAGMKEKEAINFPKELTKRVRQSRFYKELLPSCIDYYETKNHIFCHGWIPVSIKGNQPHIKYQYDSNWRNASPYKWKQARWLNGLDMSCKYKINEPGKTVVCGHWNTSYGHSKFGHNGSEWGENAIFSPFYSEGIIAIDACTAFSGTVNCVLINDQEA